MSDDELKENIQNNFPEDPRIRLIFGDMPMHDVYAEIDAGQKAGQAVYVAFLHGPIQFEVWGLDNSVKHLGAKDTLEFPDGTQATVNSVWGYELL